MPSHLTVVPMLWGEPGIGKSAIVKSIAKQNNWGIYDVRIAFLNPEDLNGVPFVNEGEFQKSYPLIFGEEFRELCRTKEKVLLFLDEINQGSPTVLRAMYQLLCDRRTGDYQLPDNCYMVAAGNPISTVVEELPTPVNNRLAHVTVKADHSSWIEWGQNNNVNPLILLFHEQTNGAYLMKNTVDVEANGVKAFQTPRTWEKVSHLLNNRELINESILTSAIYSIIGKEAGVQFLKIFKIRDKFPSVKEILDGQAKPITKNQLKDTEYLNVFKHIVVNECLDAIAKVAIPTWDYYNRRASEVIKIDATNVPDEPWKRKAMEFTRTDPEKFINLRTLIANLLLFGEAVFGDPEQIEWVAGLHAKSRSHFCLGNEYFSEDFRKRNKFGKYRFEIIWLKETDEQIKFKNPARGVINKIIENPRIREILESYGS